MKCPHCGKNIMEQKPDVFSVWFPNMLLLIPLGAVLQLLPWDIEHGYSLNWDMIILLGCGIVYFVYLMLYVHWGWEGRLVLFKRQSE